MTPKELKELTATIKAKVASDPRWAQAAITTLYARQTAQEQSAEHTIEQNGVGFSGVDGEILSSFAVRLASGKPLTPKQLAVAYRTLPKYAAQLARVAAEKANAGAPMVQSAQPVEDAMSAEELAEERAAVAQARADAAPVRDGIAEDVRWGDEFGRIEAAQERAAYTAEMQNDMTVERMMAAARAGQWTRFGTLLSDADRAAIQRVGREIAALTASGYQWTVAPGTPARDAVLCEIAREARLTE